ncbi:MAG: Xaa-Pro peptidase family protein [Pseudomonadota bacterium]
MIDRSSLVQEIQNRIERFQALMKKQDFDGALIIQKVDLYYLTGTDQDAHLWVPASGQPLLMVRKSMERALADAALEQIVPLNRFSQLPDYINSYGGKSSGTMGLEMDVLPVKNYLTYLGLFPDKEMVDISSLIREARMIKSPFEISCIRKAAKMADRLYEKIPEFIHQSETEIQLASKAEAFYRNEGHPGMTRMRTFNMETIYGHIMAGPSSTLPGTSPGPTAGSGPGPFFSQGSGFNRIIKHEPIIVDYASSVDGYLSDQSRIFSIGKLCEKFYRAHDVMLEVQDTLAQEGRPGVRAKELYTLAINIIEKAGLSEGFMGFPLPVPFVAHGIGLEMDEWPLISKDSDQILQQGMVISMEPKFVFPEEGVVGIENTLVITEHGMEKLNRFPDDIVIC